MERPSEPAPDSHQLIEAKRIYLAVRELGLAQREDLVARECGGDSALRALVFELLGGDDAPMPFASLAEDIRAAREELGPELTAEVARVGPGSRVQRLEPAGDRIGRYRLLERIGEGGFGVVYLAQQEEPVKRRVALKILKLGMDTKQIVARFEAERQALALMEHPNIARVFDAGATDSGRPYFVMELVRGQPITEYCDERKLDIRARLGLFARVCDALQHAHQKGIIHRDIKPSNVLVSEDGEEAVPKIIDFGIAKATSAVLTDKTLFTEMRQMIGTPEYMSPEQAGTTSLDVDTRTDVYSLGVLMYELLAGATPFDSKRLRSAAYAEIQRIIRDEDPPRPSTRLTTLAGRETVAAVRGGVEPERLRSALAGELDWVVMKCLEKDRGRRYDSAGALMRDVRRFIEGEAVQAVPPSATYRASKFVRKNRGLVVAISVVTLALVAGLVGTSVGFANAVAQRNIAHAERERANTNAAEAHEAETIARRGAYSANVLSACAALEANRTGIAKDFLASAPTELRGWEWRYLESQLDTSIRSIPCPIPAWLAGASSDSWTLRLWSDGSRLLTTSRHTGAVAALWDLDTGHMLRSLERSPDPGHELVRATPLEDGGWLAVERGMTPDSGSMALSLWNPMTGEQRSVQGWSVPAGTSLAAIDRSMLALMRRGTSTWVADPTTGAVISPAVALSEQSLLSAFTPDQQHVVLMCERGRIEVRDARSLELVGCLTGHSNIIHGFDFSRDGRFFATASIDRRAAIFDLGALSAETPPLMVLEHPNTVENVRFSPDGRLLATSGSDRAIRVWDLGAGAAGTSSGTPQAPQIAQFTSPTLVAGPLMFLNDNATIAGQEEDGTVRFWEVSAEGTVRLRGHRGQLLGTGVSPATGMILSTGWDGWRGGRGCLRLWDLESGEAIATLGEDGEIPYDLAISPDGKWVATTMYVAETSTAPPDRVRESRLDVFDLVRGNARRIHIGTVRGDIEVACHGAAFDPSGTRLATWLGSELRIYDAGDGRLVTSRSFAPKGGLGLKLAWSADGGTIAATIFRNGLEQSRGLGMILDAKTLDVRFVTGEMPLSCINFSSDSKIAYFGSRDGHLRGYDARSGERIVDLKAHDAVIMSITFNADGSRMATVGGDEGDIAIWDTTRFPSFEKVARFHTDDFVCGAVWNLRDDGVERLVAGSGREVRVFEPAPVRERVAARDARRAAVTRVEHIVTTALKSVPEDPFEALEKELGAGEFSELERRTARQLLVQRRLESAAVR